MQERIARAWNRRKNKANDNETNATAGILERTERLRRLLREVVKKQTEHTTRLAALEAAQTERDLEPSTAASSTCNWRIGCTLGATVQNAQLVASESQLVLHKYPLTLHLTGMADAIQTGSQPLQPVQLSRAMVNFRTPIEDDQSALGSDCWRLWFVPIGCSHVEDFVGKLPRCISRTRAHKPLSNTVSSQRQHANFGFSSPANITFACSASHVGVSTPISPYVQLHAVCPHRQWADGERAVTVGNDTLALWSCGPASGPLWKMDDEIGAALDLGTVFVRFRLQSDTHQLDSLLGWRSNISLLSQGMNVQCESTGTTEQVALYLFSLLLL